MKDIQAQVAEITADERLSNWEQAQQIDQLYREYYRERVLATVMPAVIEWLNRGVSDDDRSVEEVIETAIKGVGDEK